MNTIEIPYYSVIFTTRRSDDADGYQQTAKRMLELAQQQVGFIEVISSSTDDGRFVTISYWQSLQAIADWKQNLEHLDAQAQGKSQWYAEYKLEVAEVTRAYVWRNDDKPHDE